MKPWKLQLKPFDVLNVNGVEKQDLIAVQPLPEGQIDITFKDEFTKGQRLTTLSHMQSVEVTNYVDGYKIVPVLHVPHKLDDRLVRFLLGSYGRILSLRDSHQPRFSWCLKWDQAI